MTPLCAQVRADTSMVYTARQRKQKQNRKCRAWIARVGVPHTAPQDRVLTSTPPEAVALVLASPFSRVVVI